jgi:DnaJ-class molecular chaperone
MTPQGWRPEYTATFARATARLREYMNSHADPCPYCAGTGIIMRRVMFRDGRLFPVACDWCRGTGRAS